MRVLVTRPIEDAGSTASNLRALGHAPLVVPLLEIRFRDGEDISLIGVQAVVVTSANGVRALARRTKHRDLSVFAVGAQTASMAREMGFSDVRNSDGDSVALADAITGWTNPNSGPLLYAAANKATSKLQERLIERGFTLRRDVLYDVVAVDTLPSTAAEALRRGELDVVLLYSPHSAETFVRCVRKAHLGGICRGLIAACISQAAANKTAGLAFREIRIASRPSEEEVLGLLGD
jgi:uroporphyrinogen-III synthase